MDRDLGSAPYTGPAQSEPELLPCPFDDGQGVHGIKVRDNGRDGCGPADTWWGQCKCGAEGPNARGPYDAITAWNRRALSPPAGPSTAEVREAARKYVAFVEALLSPPAGGDGDRIAAFCDFALSDSLTERTDERGEKYSVYDGAIFAERLAGNGYKIVPLSAGGDGVREALGQMLAFLLGSGPLDGVWFGDDPPAGKPRYWWRTQLRALLSPTGKHDE